MENLTRPQLALAEQYITSCGNGMNPISVLMELGQQLHISPEFDSYEPQYSTVHLHVFNCKVKFAQYDVEAQGHNKKRVKTDAAKKMLDRLLHEAKSVLLRGDERIGAPRVSPSQHRPYTLAQTQQSSAAAPSSHSSQSISSIGNSIGKLQELCVASKLGLPIYSFQEESLTGNSRKFIATAQVRGYPIVQSESLNTKMEAKKLAAHKMYTTIVKQSEDNTDNATTQATEDFSNLDTLGYNLAKLQVAEEDELTAPRGKSSIIGKLKNIFSDCKKILSPELGYSAVDRVTMLSKSENFPIEFHLETSPNGDSHLCLLEAKIGNGLVCHGIEVSQSKAKELAANNMLSLISFFCSY